MGQATSVGKLSVPAGWAAVTPVEPAAAAPLDGSGWTAVAEEAAGWLGLRQGCRRRRTGRGGYGAAPRYGIKPTVTRAKVLV